MLFIVFFIISLIIFKTFKEYEGFSNSNIIDYGEYGKVKTNPVEVADNVYKTPFFLKNYAKN